MAFEFNKVQMTFAFVVVAAISIYDVKNPIFSEFYQATTGHFIDHTSRENLVEIEFLTSKMAIATIAM